jgi:hypothetical protein
MQRVKQAATLSIVGASFYGGYFVGDRAYKRIKDEVNGHVKRL